MNKAEHLERMLELVAQRIGDPAPRVYERLFEQEPALREMFVLDTHGAARGEMFHRAVETLLDLAQGQAYARAMVEAEWSNHRMNGVSKAQFQAFFELMGQVFREALGADWSTELECSWRDSVARIALITGAAADAA